MYAQTQWQLSELIEAICIYFETLWQLSELRQDIHKYIFANTLTIEWNMTGHICLSVYIRIFDNTMTIEWIRTGYRCIFANTLKIEWIKTGYIYIHRVIQEESALLWEMIVWVILSKKVHMNMGPILNGYGVMGIF